MHHVDQRVFFQSVRLRNNRNYLVDERDESKHEGNDQTILGRGVLVKFRYVEPVIEKTKL